MGNKSTPPAGPTLSPEAELHAAIQKLEHRIGTLEGKAVTLEQLVAKLESQRAELDMLGKEIRSMIVSRGREVGHDEAVEIIEADPSRRFTVMAPYPTLGLRPGDAIDPRQRFEHPARDLPHHIRSGLRVAPAPAA